MHIIVLCHSVLRSQGSTILVLYTCITGKVRFCMEELIKNYFYKDFETTELKKHAANLELLHMHFIELLGFDPGKFTCMAYYFSQVTRSIREPVLVDKRIVRELQNRALNDELTGLGNRRLFDIVLSREFAAARRSGVSFSIIFIDIDCFKDYNDTYGHLEGDKVLAAVASILRKNSRSSDYCLRYGGEEFALLLPHTPLDYSVLLAERLRKLVERHEFPNRGVTISAGVAELGNADQDSLAIVERADKALYRAKMLGRNTICSDENDNRRTPRFNISIPVMLTVHEATFQQDLAETINISRGGMLLESSLHPNPTTINELCLYDTANCSFMHLEAKTVSVVKNEKGQSRIACSLMHGHRRSFDNFFNCLLFRDDGKDAVQRRSAANGNKLSEMDLRFENLI